MPPFFGPTSKRSKPQYKTVDEASGFRVGLTARGLERRPLTDDTEIMRCANLWQLYGDRMLASVHAQGREVCCMWQLTPEEVSEIANQVVSTPFETPFPRSFWEQGKGDETVTEIEKRERHTVQTYLEGAWTIIPESKRTEIREAFTGRVLQALKQQTGPLEARVREVILHRVQELAGEAVEAREQDLRERVQSECARQFDERVAAEVTRQLDQAITKLRAEMQKPVSP
jgi:hypothetical protein